MHACVVSMHETAAAAELRFDVLFGKLLWMGVEENCRLDSNMQQ